MGASPVLRLGGSGEQLAMRGPVTREKEGFTFDQDFS